MHIQRVDDPNNKEIRLYCYSEQREEKEQGINRRFCERFEAGLKNIADGLGKPRTDKRQGKLHERIGRLKEKSKGIGQHYDIELLPDASGNKAVELRWTKQPQAGTRLTHPGVYCLRSNQCDWCLSYPYFPQPDLINPSCPFGVIFEEPLGKAFKLLAPL